MANPNKRKQKDLRRQNRKKKNTKTQITESNVLEHVKNFPIFESCKSGDLFEQGIGHVIVARRSPDGMILASVFMIDVFCLGVKDCFYRYMSQSQYEHFKVLLMPDEELLEASNAKKLVLDSVVYAEKFHLQPHEDYQKTRKGLEGIDENKASLEFEFGKKFNDEKLPFYCAGPHDSESRMKEVLTLLERYAGKDNFHYIIPNSIR